MVWQIEGKRDDEIAKLLRQRQHEIKAPPPPRPEPVYYTDKEYEALKLEREKIGIHYLDQIPNKEELDQRLKPGMSETDVTAVMGPAKHTLCDDAKQVTELCYELAPERRGESQEMRPSGLMVHFNGGKVTNWGFNYSNAPREGKPPKGSPRGLNAKMPGAGFADRNFGTVQWIEGIELSLKNGHDKPLPQDYVDCMSLIRMAAELDKKPTLIEANCAVVKILAEAFPKVEALRKTAENDKISLSKLQDLLEPYLCGAKPLPANLLLPKPDNQ